MKISLHDKVKCIFGEFAGERAKNLDASKFPASITSTITAALSAEPSDENILHNDQIAFHLTDWSNDAAFLVALHLFPERFSQEEIQEGVTSFLVHVPHHVIAAARLGGYSTEDIFNDPNS